MAKANMILQNSILWNLREVTKLAEEIKGHCGDVDCVSWRYPLASCSELEIYKLLQTNRNLDNYTYVLELTYDRLLYLFNLMIKYLESRDSLKRFRPGRNVHRPKTLSLASVLHMIWDRIQAYGETGSRGTQAPASQDTESEDALSLRELTTSKSSICTQSEVCSISLCSCCEMVQTFVTQLVLEMEKLFQKQEFSSAILDERKIMREYLVEMTSWSAMTRWLTAIIKDFTTLSEKLDQVTTSSRKLRHRLDSGERKMKSRLEQHEEDTRKLENRLKDKESKLSDMKQKLEKLTEERAQLKEEVKQKNSELEMKEAKMEQMKKGYEKRLKEKKEKMQKEDQERQEMKASLEAERKKLEEVERQNENLEKIVLQMKADWESLNAKADEDKNGLTNRLREAELELECMQQERLSLSLSLEEKDKKIKEYSERIMAAFPDLTESPKPKYTASGDPEIDMENQIEANRLRIELLQTENEKLQATLDKIKSLKGC